MKSKEEIEKLIQRLENTNKELPYNEEWATMLKYCNNTAIMYLKWVISE